MRSSVSMLTIKGNTSCLNLDRNESRLQNQVCIPQKRMLNIWWDVKDVIYWELLPKKATINAMRYLQQPNYNWRLKSLTKGKMYFQHDNAKPHQNVVKEKISQVWSRAPTSPTVFARPCPVPLIDQ